MDKWILFLIIIFSTESIAQLDQYDASDTAYYPETQKWIVTSVEKTGDLPKDAGGIPFILINSAVYLSEDLFTFKEINSGDDTGIHDLISGSAFVGLLFLPIIGPYAKWLPYIWKVIPEHIKDVDEIAEYIKDRPKKKKIISVALKGIETLISKRDRMKELISKAKKDDVVKTTDESFGLLEKARGILNEIIEKSEE